MRWTPPIELSEREAKMCKRHETHRRFYRFLRVHRHQIFDDSVQEQLAQAYSDQPRGTDPVPPALLGAVFLLQAYTRCSDKDAVYLTEHDLRWQMVLDCLGCESAPFSQSSLQRFRDRLVQHQLGLVLLRKTFDLAKQTNDLAPAQVAVLRVALDSMPLEGAARVEDTLNLLARALRLLVMVMASSLGLSDEQVIESTGASLLKGKSPKAALDLDWNHPEAQDLALRQTVEQLDRAEAWWQQQRPAGTSLQSVEQARDVIEHLRQQNTELNTQGQVQMRQGVVADRQISLTDPEMRHGRKSQTERIEGYKKYVALDVDQHLILDACVLPANVPESRGADKLQPEIQRYGQVGELLIDRAFLDAQLTKEVTQNGSRLTCRALHGGVKGLFRHEDFEVDLKSRQVRCPAGVCVPIGVSGHVQFTLSKCGRCPKRAQCQTKEAKQGRRLQIGPNEAMYQRLRAEEKTVEGRARLRQRTVIEHAQARHGQLQGSRARYVGVLKNDLDVRRIAAVQNLMELARREFQASQAAQRQAA